MVIQIKHTKDLEIRKSREESRMMKTLINIE